MFVPDFKVSIFISLWLFALNPELYCVSFTLYLSFPLFGSGPSLYVIVPSFSTFTLPEFDVLFTTPKTELVAIGTLAL